MQLEIRSTNIRFGRSVRNHEALREFVMKAIVKSASDAIRGWAVSGRRASSMTPRRGGEVDL